MKAGCRDLPFFLNSVEKSTPSPTQHDRHIWVKPWSLAEGFLIALGLVATGLMLELSIGPVVWEAFSWPINIFVLSGMLALMSTMYALRGKVYAFRFIGTYTAAVPVLIFAVLLTMIMGLTRQTMNGRWLNDMLSFWPFVLIYVYIAFILSQIIIRRILHFHLRRDIPFLLNHLGLFTALVCATLGNADMQRLKMIAAVDEAEWRAMNEQGDVVELPLAIELKRFIMEEYPAEEEVTTTERTMMKERTPRRFASDVQIYTQSGLNISATVDVNKPVSVAGWQIYQYGYDTVAGAMSRISIFELVRDPWLPFVYIGIWMMLLGAVCMFILAQRK